MRYLQVELPSLHLRWVRKNGDSMIASAIRTNYAKPSLCYVSSIVQKTGLDVEVIDMKIRNQDTIIPYKTFPYGNGTMTASRMGISFESVADEVYNADILGLSINPTSWSNIARDFMRYAKSINPKLVILIGGNEAIFRSEHYLRERLADIAVMGEAENTIHALIESLKGKRSLDSVDGIAYEKNGTIIKTKASEKPLMDSITFPALNLLEKDIPLWTTPVEYFPLPRGVEGPAAWMFASRGCDYRCDYCTTPQKMGKFRFKSLERVSMELDFLKKYGIRVVHIWDDSLSSVMHPDSLGKELGREYIIAFAKMLRDKGFAYELSQGGLVIKDLWDAEKNHPDIKLIEEFFTNTRIGEKFVGFYGQYFPMECLQIANPHERYAKLMTFEKEKEVLRAILGAGEVSPAISYSSIIGASEDTVGGFKLAARRLRELNELVMSKGGKYLATPFIHSIFPGTKVWEKYEKKLVYGINEFPELYQFQTAPHQTDNFSPEELTLAKNDMEQKLMPHEQYKKWKNTGRYQW